MSLKSFICNTGDLPENSRVARVQGHSTWVTLVCSRCPSYISMQCFWRHRHLFQHLISSQNASFSASDSKTLQQNEHQETGDRWEPSGPSTSTCKVSDHHFSLNPSCPKDEMGWHFLTSKVTMEIQTNRSQCSV